MSKAELNGHGFKYTNHLLEAYLEAPTAWSAGLTGRGLKQHLKQAARAHADGFSREPGTPNNRIFFRTALEGAGVHTEAAFYIAEHSEANVDGRHS